MLLSNSSLPTPHREDNKLVDKISGWPSAGATSNRPQTTLATTNIPRFYQRPISGNTPLPKKKSLEEPKSYRYSGALQLSSYSEMPNSRNLDYLATKRKYSATTQSAWDEIDWNKKLISKFPNTVQPHKQSVPDPVANSNRIPRYYPSSFNWQRLGNSWDYFQPRNIPEKRVSEFISPYKENLKIPGYTGYTRLDRDESFKDIYSCSNIHEKQQPHIPNYTFTSRGANIPGYSGCQYWTQSRPSHHIMDHRGVYSATTLREFKFLKSPCMGSPFTRSGVLSKMITLTNPYNPFIKQP